MALEYCMFVSAAERTTTILPIHIPLPDDVDTVAYAGDRTEPDRIRNTLLRAVCQQQRRNYTKHD